MKIERVDENTIKCYISTEEMEKYQVEYTDFLSRTDKAQELMRTIMRQAKDEVGYRPPKFAFEMQIMMVPDQGMVLTFTEKEPFDTGDQAKMETFINSLKDFVEKLGKQKEKLENGDPIPPFLGGGAPAQTPVQPAQPAANGELPPDYKVLEAVFAFATISQIMDFVEILPPNTRIRSALYKMGETYYLHIQQGTASYDRYSRVCVRALEFGDLYRADKGCDEMLKEHGECLIAEKAVRKLRGKA